MMILLSKAEYNDLLKRAGNADVLADEKLESLKKDIRQKVRKMLQDVQTGYADHPRLVLQQICELLQ